MDCGCHNTPIDAFAYKAVDNPHKTLHLSGDLTDFSSINCRVTFLSVAYNFKASCKSKSEEIDSEFLNFLNAFGIYIIKISKSARFMANLSISRLRKTTKSFAESLYATS